MKKEAGDHEKRIEQVMQRLAKSKGLDQQSIREHTEETTPIYSAHTQRRT
jgi:hypothetical protein